MIPVRVKADIRPPVTPEIYNITENHPLARLTCPACDYALTSKPVVLAIIGFDPASRKPSGWATGASIAVHMECAGYTKAELAALAEEQP